MSNDEETLVLLPDEDGEVQLTLNVNGHHRKVTARPTQSLLDVLRDELRLYGARSGCGVGICGACTVLRDGAAVNSCLTLAGLCADAEITTVEGLNGDEGELSPVQDAFLRHRAFQCSYCTSGFILALEALVRRNPRPTEEDVRHAFSGQVCRCGSYTQIMAAAMEFVAVESAVEDLVADELVPGDANVGEDR
jgi:aerobic-type carbon monoxide dehydrogenase small subunit (CoxS/CutS family)